jgi:hypothetical protein
MRPALALLASTLLACASWSPDPDLYGLQLDNRSSQAWAQRDDFRTRLRVIIAASLTEVDATPAQIAGIRLVVKDGSVDCNGAEATGGCWDELDRTLTVSTDAGPCAELLLVAHELRHAVHGDPFHLSGGWSAVDAFRETLAAGHEDDCGRAGRRR